MENDLIQQQVKLFKDAMLAVSHILNIAPIKITASQYTKACKEHNIEHLTIYKARELGGFVYLRDGLFKHLRKQVKKEQNRNHTVDIILQQFKDYVDEHKDIPTIKEFKKFCTIPLGEFYKDIASP